MWPAIWKFVASSPMWLVATSTFGSRDCDIGKWAITCYNLEWFTSKRWSLTRKNIKGEPNFARSTPTKPICTKHQTSSRPCIKPESTDGWKCSMRVDWNPGFTEWILRKKKHSYAEQVNLDSISCNMFGLIRGFDPPHWPGFWFLHWLVLV